MMRYFFPPGRDLRSQYSPGHNGFMAGTSLRRHHSHTNTFHSPEQVSNNSDPSSTTNKDGKLCPRSSEGPPAWQKGGCKRTVAVVAASVSSKSEAAPQSTISRTKDPAMMMPAPCFLTVVRQSSGVSSTRQEKNVVRGRNPSTHNPPFLTRRRIQVYVQS
jgi:hypothetical protein